MIDFLTSTLIGNSLVKIVCPAACRLNTRLPFVTERYTKHFMGSMVRHRLLEKLETIAEHEMDSTEAARKVNKVDEDSKRYMIAAEKHCRRLTAGTILFTPEVATMI